MLGAVAVDSDAHTFETRRYRNAFATAAMHWSRKSAKRGKDKREQGVGRFRTRNVGAKRTYIAITSNSFGHTASGSAALACRNRST